jgi:hypothetical protein
MESMPSSVVKYIMAGFTLPVNQILYDRQIDSNNTLYDATSACRTVTSKACEKLKEDNPNLKIYVVKYKKQDGDYGYIDSCASDDSYVYNVNTDAAAKENLAKALANIAADIKSSANYEAAKNVP